jgi:hypothetical protein
LIGEIRTEGEVHKIQPSKHPLHGVQTSGSFAKFAGFPTRLFSGPTNSHFQPLSVALIIKKFDAKHKTNVALWRHSRLRFFKNPETEKNITSKL